VHNPSSALRVQVWYGRADEVDGADQIGRDLMIDLRIGKLLRRTEQPVTRIADSNVVWTHSVECVVHELPGGCGVCEAEHGHRQSVAVLRLHIGNGILTPYRSHDLIASDKQALRHEPSFNPNVSL
jgi:hypothetical protein